MLSRYVSSHDNVRIKGSGARGTIKGDGVLMVVLLVSVLLLLFLFSLLIVTCSTVAMDYILRRLQFLLLLILRG